MAEHLFTSQEAADYLRMNIGTFRNRRSQGTMKLPFVKIGSRIHFIQKDLEDYVASCRVEAA